MWQRHLNNSTNSWPEARELEQGGASTNSGPSACPPARRARDPPPAPEGWAVHLAALKNPSVVEMERRTSTYLLGRLILGDEAAGHFFDSNEKAMAYLQGPDI